MILSFTGTHRGLRWPQSEMVEELITLYDPELAVHGACEGGDDEFDRLCVKLHVPRLVMPSTARMRIPDSDQSPGWASQHQRASAPAGARQADCQEGLSPDSVPMAQLRGAQVRHLDHGALCSQDQRDADFLAIRRGEVMINVRRVRMCHNGCIIVQDTDDKEVPELQEPWFLDVVHRIEKAGTDPTRVQFEMPNGNTVRVERIQTKGGFTWRLR